MKQCLYSYQKDVLPQIAAGQPTYLGFDPGLGKSRTALEAAKQRGVKSLLIISPASGVYVWERECRMWWPQMPFAVVRNVTDLTRHSHSEGWRGIRLVTYGLLSQKKSIWASAIAVGRKWDMTILDEAAAVKNTGANRTRAILITMLPKLGYLLPLSGTPAPNHAGELYSILKAVYPKAITTGDRLMTQFEFEEAFCKVVNKRFGMGRDVRVIEGSKNLPELRRRMEGFMVRVRKEDVLKDLPPIRWDVVPIEPEKLDLPDVPAGLSDDDLIKYLSGRSGDEHIMRLRRLLGLSKVSGAIDYLNGFLENAPRNQKILVFAHHKDVILHLMAGLLDWKPVCVTGGTPPVTRATMIDAFLTDPHCRVFIGNIAAAGTALTLVGPQCHCSDVFFVEASFSVGDNAQAACRVHRIGQKEAVVARMLTAHGTIDDRITDILARKASDFSQLFN